MTSQAHVGAGSIARLSSVLDELGSESVFLVTGAGSYARSGAEQAMAPALKHRRVTHWSKVTANPDLTEVRECLAALACARADVIVAVGGGSAIDTAKLIALLSAQDRAPGDVARGGALAPAVLPVIAIPTTAGSGAEVTPFAVFYVDKVKHTLTHDTILPRHAIIDPELTYSLPPSITAATGLDALAQAMESLWCVNSNDASLALGREALSMLFASITAAVRRPDPASRARMSEGAYLAGKAIAITRTTVPHALSYGMTMNHGVPHGHAVALTLGATLEFNCGVSEGDVTDARGARYVHDRMGEIIRTLGCTGAAEARATLEELIRACGLPSRLGEVGARSAAQRRVLAASVDAERLGNNPRAMSSEAVQELIDSVA